MRRSCRAVLTAMLATLAVASHASAEQDPEALVSEGTRAMAERRLDHAVTAFERAARLRPSDPEIAFLHATALFAVKRIDDSEREYRRLLEIDPTDARGWNGLGNVEHTRRNLEGALQAYRKAVEVDPGFLLAWYHLGWIAAEAERNELAIDAFEACLALDASSELQRDKQHDARYRLGAILYGRGEWERALELLSRVVRREPAHPNAHYFIGQAAMRLGRRELAEAHLEKHRELLDRVRRSGSVASVERP